MIAAAPIASAVAMLLIGYTFLVRARVNGPGETYSPRALRRVAIFFFLIGAAMIAVSLIQFAGAH